MARLERRVYVIERNLTEEAEKVSKEKTGKPAFTLSDIEQFTTRIGALEKHLAEISEDVLSARTNTSDRLYILDATPLAGPSFAEDVPGTVEPAITSAEKARNDDEDDSSGGNSGEQDTRLEVFLSAAREAAKNVVEHTEPSDSDEDDSQIMRWKQQTHSLLQASAKLHRKILPTRIVSVPIVLVGLVLATWTAMSAGKGLDSVPLDASNTASGTVIALAMSSPPQPAFLRLEAMMAAADAGDANAQTALGRNYLNGDGVAADMNEALRWLQLASGNGHAVAQYTLATIYARSSSANSDPFAAKFWFQSAAEQGNRMAMNDLAMFYTQGLGTDQDTTEAAHWFAMAAALGFKVAQFNLAVLYERGEGVLQDNLEAYKWYAIAAAQGDRDAQARAALLAENMDPDVFLVVQNEVSSFAPAAMDPKVNNLPQFNSATG